MLNSLTETFLSEYFTYGAIFGEFCENRAVFNRLAEAFCLNDKNLVKLYQATEREAVKEINFESDFNRFKRIQQYNELIGNKQVFFEEENNLIAIKGESIKLATKLNLKAPEYSTKGLILKTLMASAQSGNIVALRALGFLQCAGIIVEQDGVNGAKNLKKAARWGDITAILATILFFAEDRPYSFALLNAAAKNTPYDFLSEVVAKQYGLEGIIEKNQEETLLQRAIYAGKLSKECYDSRYDRFIFGQTIGIKDKERILFSENKEIFSEACNLPLKLFNSELSVNEDAFSQLCIDRLDEKKSVQRGLLCSDLRARDEYRPMCLFSKSNFVLDVYLRAVSSALKDAHVEKIEMSDLREYDFEPTRNNVFIRGLREKKNNVYFLVFRGEVSEMVIEMSKTVLRSDRRRSFRLSHPAITLDLSCVLPICFCDEANAQKLKSLVEFVELSPVQEREKSEAVKEILIEKGIAYGIRGVSASQEVLNRFYRLPIEKSESVIDNAIRNNREKGKELNLTLEVMKDYFSNDIFEKNSYGFGGDIHDSH